MKDKRQLPSAIDPSMMETKRIIKWIDGSPTAIEQHSMNKHQVGNTLGVIMANEYLPVDDEDRERNQGKTNAQVLLERLVENAMDGDLNAMKEVLDRMVGKPIAHQVQDIRAMNVNMTYEDFLDSIDEEDLELDDFEIEVPRHRDDHRTHHNTSTEDITDVDIADTDITDTDELSFESGYNAEYKSIDDLL